MKVAATYTISSNMEAEEPHFCSSSASVYYTKPKNKNMGGLGTSTKAQKVPDKLYIYLSLVLRPTQLLSLTVNSVHEQFTVTDFSFI